MAVVRYVYGFGTWMCVESKGMLVKFCLNARTVSNLLNSEIRAGDVSDQIQRWKQTLLLNLEAVEFYVK